MQDTIRNITPAELQARLDDGFSGTLLDVREADELRSTGVIPGVVHIPLGSLPGRLESLPAGRPVVVVCRSGARSMRAAQQLVEAGILAENLAGGMLAWLGEGRPVDPYLL
ncbi:MAG TPA: rhodanese-like domain-containing protein [Myxococcaceae bacterium]|nr:rhodanese-like domain-containing protein [Myxococcaceae bacterium]